MDANAPARTQTPLPAGFLTGEKAARVGELAAAAKAPATRVAYRRDWKRWAEWCAARGAQPMPPAPELVALYVQEHAGLRKPDGAWQYQPATLERWVAALSSVSRAAGRLPPGQHPIVESVLQAVWRTRGSRQRKADPLLVEDLRAVCVAIADSARSWATRVAARRDTALLTAAVIGGYRRSELAAHQLRDVTYYPGEGLQMYVARLEPGQEGKGLVKHIPFGEDPLVCPVCAILKWVEVVRMWEADGRAGLMRLLLAPGPDRHVCGEIPDLPVSSAPLFRGLHRTRGLLDGGLSGHAVNEIIQRRCAEAGLDQTRVLTGHSPRSGFVTEGFRAGADATEIAKQTGHKSYWHLAGYRRDHAPIAGNAVTRIRF